MAGTEQGIKEPQATFSACFGAAFIMLHPMKYAAMLAEKMQRHGATGWLVNTGWSGGRYAFVIQQSRIICTLRNLIIIIGFFASGNLAAMVVGAALNYHTQGRLLMPFTLEAS